MNWVLVHAIYAPLVTGIPLAVVGIVAWVARCDARAAGRRLELPGGEITRLVVLTLPIWIGFWVWIGVDRAAFAAGERGAILGATEIGASLLLFWCLGAPTLGKVSAAARRSVADPARGTRSRRCASLKPRRISDHLPWPILSLPFLLCGTTLVLLGMRIYAAAGQERRIFLPSLLACVALGFVLLYAAWIREEVRGPRALSGEADEREQSDLDSAVHRRVRAIFALQTLLAAFFSIMALFVFELDWRSIASGALIVLGGIASAVIGVIGCALAISSKINERWLNVLARQIH